LASLTNNCNEIQTKIDSIPAEIIDIANITKQIRHKENDITSLMLKVDKDEETLKIKQGLYERILEFIENFELSKFQKAKVQIDSKKALLSEHETEIDKLNSDYDYIIKKEKLLSEHQYDPDCRFCCENEFVKEAQSAVANKVKVEREQHALLDLVRGVQEQINKLEPMHVEAMLDRYDKMKESKNIVSAAIADLNLEIERTRNSILTAKNDLSDLITLRDEYEENKEAIENLESLVAELNNCHYSIEQTKDNIEGCEVSTLKLVKLLGSQEQKLKNLKEQKQEYQDLQTEFAAYDLYMQCMHPNGIAYDVIKKKIPVINSEIAKVLANIVEFEVFFEATGNKFDILIKHPQYDERPIEMASGAEKSLSAMAIRLALLGVSSLPTGDLFILDEPGTALDEDNMSGFIQILELIKVYFKNVLLISHLDSLKDCVDMQIVIDKKAGYAKVNQ
jgi:exonuclease SbcC